MTSINMAIRDLALMRCIAYSFHEYTHTGALPRAPQQEETRG